MSNAIPVAELERPEVRALVGKATIVLGVDPDGNESIFYGRSLLEDIARRGHTTEYGPQAVISFAVDFQTDEPEYLCAALTVLKGACDYEEAGPPA